MGKLVNSNKQIFGKGNGGFYFHTTNILLLEY
jgi:hypothetical protein